MTTGASASLQTPTQHTDSGATRRKAVTGAVVGHFVEWYDFAVYGFMATVIGALFFPSADPLVSLLSAFAVYGVGYAARPLGAIVFGHYGDKFGRKRALAASILMMGIATFCLGLLPTHETAGTLAPVLLVLVRLIQGFSVGGEFAGGASFIVEYAQPGRRGWLGGWQQFATGGGFLAGALIGFLLTNQLSEDTLYAWAWRVPFLVSIVVASLGLYVRFSLADTPEFRSLQESDEVESAPLLRALKTEWPGMLQILGISVLWTIAYTVFLSFIPSYLVNTGNFKLSEALLVSAIGIGLFIVLCPLMGVLSDKVGRKPLMLTASVLFMVVSIPAFHVLQDATFSSAVLVNLAIAAILALLSGPAPAAMAEMFSTKVRYSGMSVAYGIGVAAFGGTAGLVATELIRRYGETAPGYYIAVASLVTTVSLVFMRETAYEDLRN